MLIFRLTFEISLFFRSIFDIAFNFSSSFFTFENDNVFYLKFFSSESTKLIVFELIQILTFVSLNDNVSKFMFLSTFVKFEFFLRQTSK